MGAAIPLIKTAILLDCCRIFVPINRTRSVFWWGCMAVIALQCLWGVLCILLLNMQCSPHEAIWEFYLPSKCYSLPDVMLTSASVQILSDLILFFFPQRIIWRLQMRKRSASPSSLALVSCQLPSHPHSLKCTDRTPAPVSPHASVSPTPSPSQPHPIQCTSSALFSSGPAPG